MDLIMDSDYKISYEYSISNFLMLKMFHDVGVPITSVSSFMMDINYSTSLTTDIFCEGTKSLFPNLEHTSSYDCEDEGEFNNMLKDLDTTGEFVYKMSDVRLGKVLASSYKETFVREAEATGCYAEHCEFEIRVNSQYGIVFIIHWEAMMHEMVEAVVTIHRLLDIYIKRIEG